MNEKEVSWILKYGAYTIITFILIAEFLDNYSDYSAEGIWYAMGVTTPMAIGALVAVYCGNKNVSWASEINRSANLAFLIGIVFGLIGLLAYWILYKIRINHPTPESTGGKIAVSILLVLTILVGAMGWSATMYEPPEVPRFEYVPMPIYEPPPEYEPYIFVPAKYQYNKYGFSFACPLDVMNISEEGYLSDDANEQSGVVLLQNERETKVISIVWYSTTRPASLEDELEESIEIAKSGLSEYLSDFSTSRVTETNISESPIRYQILDYRVEGIKVHSVIGVWYDTKTQRMFYVGIDTYDEKETEKLFNEFLDSFSFL